MRPFILIGCLLFALVIGPLAAYRVGFDAGRASVETPERSVEVASVSSSESSTSERSSGVVLNDAPALSAVGDSAADSSVPVSGAAEPTLDLVPVALDRSNNEVGPFSSAEAEVVTIKEILEVVSNISDPRERRQKCWKPPQGSL